MANPEVRTSDMSLTSWNAYATNTNVYRILNNHAAGTIHSVFNNSFNLIFGERIVHIGSLEHGLAPFGIGMQHLEAQQLTREIQGNESVVWNAKRKQIVIGNNHSLSLQQVLLTNHSLTTHTFNPSIIKNNLTYVASFIQREQWQTGIVQTAEENGIVLHYILSELDSSTSTPVIDKLAEVVLVAMDEQSVDAQSVFDYWIGRGPGLTPSGDDLLTGICASLSLLDGESNHLHTKLADYIMAYGLKRTTQIGYEYLYYATRHMYHSHLIKLCKALLKPQDSDLLIALQEMKAIGHTSGTDTLIGILLGMKIGMKLKQINEG